MTNLLEKKIEDYDYDAYNSVADGELMVKITLAEYRKLVATAACAEADIREANNARWAAEKELKKAKPSWRRSELPTAMRCRMCQMCRQNPCHNMCPNAEPRETLTCCRCGYEYFPEEAEDYVRFSNGDVVCNGCLHDYCVEVYG